MSSSIVDSWIHQKSASVDSIVTVFSSIRGVLLQVAVFRYVTWRKTTRKVSSSCLRGPPSKVCGGNSGRFFFLYYGGAAAASLGVLCCKCVSFRPCVILRGCMRVEHHSEWEDENGEKEGSFFEF